MRLVDRIDSFSLKKCRISHHQLFKSPNSENCGFTTSASPILQNSENGGLTISETIHFAKFLVTLGKRRRSLQFAKLKPTLTQLDLM